MVVLLCCVASPLLAAPKLDSAGDSFVPSLLLRHPWLDPQGRPLPFTSDQEILDFLRSAEVVGSELVGEGMNQTRKVLLQGRGLQMHAAFRNVHVDRFLPDPLLPNFEKCHRDDYRFEVAAYRLSRLLGLRVVPPTVLRKVDGHEGSLQAWVERSMMEKQRREKGIEPPDQWYWMSQMLTMRLFDNLVGNVDRHQGNLLIHSSWEIWLIDHTRAFRRWPEPHSPEKLQYCRRDVWENLVRLDEKSVRDCCAGLLRDPEIKALMQRRDRVLAEIRKHITESGADKILF